MQSADCRVREQLAEDMANDGLNFEAMKLFLESAECWKRWEAFAKAANCYERAYEHAMLCQEYGLAGETMMNASHAWIKQGEHEKFEIDCQIASEAFILAAEKEKNPRRFIDGAFCAILGGDLDMARYLIHAAAETTRGEGKELINLALMLSEYQFGDADMYIEAAVARVMGKDDMVRIRELFSLTFVGFVRTTLESELVVSIKNLSKSSGLPEEKVESLIKWGIEEGLVPGYLDEETHEVVVDSDRADITGLTRRKRPIMSSDLRDPGAWDIDTKE